MIQWYPGHMKKARDEITEAIQRIDVVIEILDARLPMSSRNPVIDELRAAKPCIRLLNKRDLADPEATDLWLTEFNREPGITAIDIEAHDASLVKTLVRMCRDLVPAETKRAARAMVVGIPNVGKSTLINTLAGRKVAKVGDQPAITRHRQNVRIVPGPKGLDVSDTPGILWPNLADQTGAYRLAASGAIRDTAVNYYDMAMFAAGFLSDRYPEALLARYKLKDLPGAPERVIEAIGKKRGCLRKGGIIDTHKASELFIHELRAGSIGRISFEIPSDFRALD